MVNVQRAVSRHLTQRGYLAGDRHEEITRQVVKCVEELGEVARQVFDGESPALVELADVCIPVFAMADIIGDEDLIEVILDKSRSDIERGVRNG